MTDRSEPSIALLLASALIILMGLPIAARAQVVASTEISVEHDSFGIEDYFRIQNFTDLALSFDGTWLAYGTRANSPEAKDRRRVYLHSLSETGKFSNPEALSDAESLAWIPGTHELAFLSARSGATQLFSYDVTTGKVRQHTRSTDSVISFRFAPDGRSVAYATRTASRPRASLYEQFRNADAGILIDPNTLSSHDFLNPQWNSVADPEAITLWTADSGSAPVRIPVPGSILGQDGTYFWSSDSRSVSLTYVGNDLPPSILNSERTSIGIFKLGSGEFQPLAKAFERSGNRPGNSFLGGEWIPGKQSVLLRRVTETDPWVSGSFPEWAIVDISEGLPNAAAWHSVELYSHRLDFLPTASSILVENTVEGEHSLFTLKAGGLEPSAIVAGLDGSSSQFQFSADLSKAVFVNESLARPPEIFVRAGSSPARKLTSFNDEVARRIHYESREVSWKSEDGLTIKGWLIEPKESGPKRPRPLITHVHGGPAFPFPNAFAPYFSYWPYPLEIYAAHGMAVFMPNYRGTHTYGRQIATAIGDDKAIEDIVSGVQALVDAGVADPARLGISGHSQGALVGPLAMARSKMFRASSFGEGASNQVVMYELMGGDANREIHDPIHGVSLYDSPQTYLDGSADLQLQGVKTASLFEGGAHTAAIFMLGLAKAAKRFGMPSEFIIYPKTAHNVAIPALQRESARRNLDWFNFWLNDREDSNPAKAEQYKRWRQMKTEANSDTAPN